MAKSNRPFELSGGFVAAALTIIVLGLVTLCFVIPVLLQETPKHSHDDDFQHVVTVTQNPAHHFKRRPRSTNASRSTEVTRDILKLLETGNLKLNETDDEAILVVGNSGSGKSTLALLIAGDNSKMEAFKPFPRGKTILIRDTGGLISSHKTTTTSKTIFPNRIYDAETRTAFYDCPGFADNRNSTIEIANTYFLRKIAHQATKLKILITIKHDSVQFGQDRSDFSQLMKHMTNLIVDVDKYQDSIALVVTKTKSDEEDGVIIEEIEAFIANEHSQKLKYNAQELKLMAALLKTDDFHNMTIKIVLLRQPTKVGILSYNEGIQENRAQIINVINDHLVMCRREDTDFGFSLTDKAIRDIQYITDDISTEIKNSFSQIGNDLQSYFRGQLTNFAVSDPHKYQVTLSSLSPYIKVIQNLNPPALLHKHQSAKILLNVTLSSLKNASSDPNLFSTIYKTLLIHGDYLDFFKEFTKTGNINPIKPFEWFQPLQEFKISMILSVKSTLDIVDSNICNTFDIISESLRTYFVSKLNQLESFTLIATNFRHLLSALNSVQSLNETQVLNVFPSQFLTQIRSRVNTIPNLILNATSNATLAAGEQIFHTISTEYRLVHVDAYTTSKWLAKIKAFVPLLSSYFNQLPKNINTKIADCFTIICNTLEDQLVHELMGHTAFDFQIFLRNLTRLSTYVSVIQNLNASPVLPQGHGSKTFLNSIILSLRSCNPILFVSVYDNILDYGEALDVLQEYTSTLNAEAIEPEKWVRPLKAFEQNITRRIVPNLDVVDIQILNTFATISDSLKNYFESQINKLQSSSTTEIAITLRQLLEVYQTFHNMNETQAFNMSPSHFLTVIMLRVYNIRSLNVNSQNRDILVAGIKIFSIIEAYYTSFHVGTYTTTKWLAVLKAFVPRISIQFDELQKNLERNISSSFMLIGDALEGQFVFQLTNYSASDLKKYKQTLSRLSLYISLVQNINPPPVLPQGQLTTKMFLNSVVVPLKSCKPNWLTLTSVYDKLLDYGEALDIIKEYATTQNATATATSPVEWIQPLNKFEHNITETIKSTLDVVDSTILNVFAKMSNPLKNYFESQFTQLQYSDKFNLEFTKVFSAYRSILDLNGIQSTNIMSAHQFLTYVRNLALAQNISKHILLSTDDEILSNGADIFETIGTNFTAVYVDAITVNEWLTKVKAFAPLSDTIFTRLATSIESRISKHILEYKFSVQNKIIKSFSSNLDVASFQSQILDYTLNCDEALGNSMDLSINPNVNTSQFLFDTMTEFSNFLPRSTTTEAAPITLATGEGASLDLLRNATGIAIHTNAQVLLQPLRDLVSDLNTTIHSVSSTSRTQCEQRSNGDVPVAVYTGIFVHLSDVIKKCLPLKQGTRHLLIFSSHTIYIDSHLDAGKGTNLNLAIAAPYWIVVGRRTLTLQGAFGSSFNRLAGISEHGTPGGPGGNGGNFFGVGLEVAGIGSLEVRSIGGMGGRGQNGGIGKNGSDGGIGDRLPYQGARDKNPNIITSDLVQQGDRCVQRVVVVAHPFAGGIASEDQSFSVVPGKSCQESRYYRKLGTPGFNGGDGGIGGLGGNRGEISYVFLPSETSMTKLKKVSRDGVKGSDGFGGSGGEGGFDGLGRFAYQNGMKRSEIAEADNIYFGGVQSNGQNGRRGGYRVGRESPVSTAQSRSDQIQLLKLFRDGRIPLGPVNAFTLPNLLKLFYIVESSCDIRNSLDPIDYIDELNYLEGQLREHDIPSDVLPLYELFAFKILNRIETSADAGCSANSSPITLVSQKSYLQLYAAVLSRISSLNTHVESCLIIDMHSYLAEVKNGIAKFQSLSTAANTLSIMQATHNKYNESISAKITEANNVILKIIHPQVAELQSLLNGTMRSLFAEIESIKSAVHVEMSQLTEKRRQLRNQMILNGVFGAIKVAATVLAFVGPVGMAAGAVIGAGASIVESFATGGRQTQIQAVTLPPAMISAKADFETKVDSSRNELIAKALTQLDATASIFKDDVNLTHLLIKTNRAIIQVKELRSSKTSIVSVQSSIKTAMLGVSSAINSSQADYTAEFLTSIVSHGTVEKFSKNLGRATAVLGVGAEIHSNIANKQSEMDEVSLALEGSEDKLKQINKFTNYMETDTAIMLDSIHSDLGGLGESLTTRSSTGLDIAKWEVVKRLKSFRYEIGSKLNGFETEEKVLRVIESIQDTFSTLINVFEQIQKFQEQAQLANFIMEINSAPFKNVHSEDSAFNIVIARLKCSVQSNVLISEYQLVLRSLKQWVFPFADIYLKDTEKIDTIKNYSTSTSVNDLVTQAVANLGKIQSEVSKNRNTYQPTDSYVVKTDFEVSVSTTPFFIWHYDSHKFNIVELLEGKTVLFKADITKVPHYHSAVKFNRIELQFQFSSDNETKALATEFEHELNYFNVEMTHMGNSYYKYESKIYAISSQELSFLFGFHKKPNGSPKTVNAVNDKTVRGDNLLSPYTMWKVTLSRVGGIQDFRKLMELSNSNGFRADLNLVGNGTYVRPGLKTTLKLENYYTAVCSLPSQGLCY